MRYGFIISILLHSIFLAITSISSHPVLVQKNKSERLIMVSILENFDTKGIQKEAKRVNLHRTQGLHKTEAIKKPSVPTANELPSPEMLTETSTNTSQMLACVDGTSTVRTLEHCVAQDIPCAGVQDFQPLQPQINKDNILQEYICKVKTEIDRKKNYPQMARRKGIEGVVRVQFCISNDGRLKGIKIDNSSGCKILDNEAVISVKAASPFLCIPEELKKEELELKVNIVFKLEEGSVL